MKRKESDDGGRVLWGWRGLARVGGGLAVVADKGPSLIQGHVLAIESPD